MSKPFTWSYKWIAAAEECPAKYKYMRDKTPEPPNIYLQRGIEVHTAGEQFLKSTKRMKVPKDYEKFAGSLVMLKENKAEAEAELCFTRKWEPTGWLAPDAWFRAKLDVMYYEDLKDELLVIDFKTGRPKPGYALQELCYKVAALTARPQAKKARLEFWYLDHGVVVPGKPPIVMRKNILTGGQKELTLRANRVEKMKKFDPKPGAHCSFCAFSQRKGGPCKN